MDGFTGFPRGDPCGTEPGVDDVVPPGVLGLAIPPLGQLTPTHGVVADPPPTPPDVPVPGIPGVPGLVVPGIPSVPVPGFVVPVVPLPTPPRAPPVPLAPCENAGAAMRSSAAAEVMTVLAIFMGPPACSVSTVTEQMWCPWTRPR